MNIWRVPLDGAHRVAGPPHQLIASTLDEIVPKFSPDGKQLVFISRRSGSEEVWSSLRDGSNPVQLTNMGHAGSPSWSPDGTHIVFDSAKEGQYEIYSVLATGGTVRRLTNHPAPDGVASYSRDGQFVYFMSARSGSEQVWRMRADGSEQTQFTRNGGYLARPSFDGKDIYYFKHKHLWRTPVTGGGEEVQLPRAPLQQFSELHRYGGFHLLHLRCRPRQRTLDRAVRLGHANHPQGHRPECGSKALVHVVSPR